MFRRSLILVLVMLGAAAVTSFAHGGHGVLNGDEPGHYLFSPDHAFPLFLLAFFVFVLVARKSWRPEKK